MLLVFRVNIDSDDILYRQYLNRVHISLTDTRGNVIKVNPHGIPCPDKPNHYEYEIRVYKGSYTMEIDCDGAFLTKKTINAIRHLYIDVLLKWNGGDPRISKNEDVPLLVIAGIHTNPRMNPDPGITIDSENARRSSDPYIQSMIEYRYGCDFLSKSGGDFDWYSKDLKWPSYANPTVLSTFGIVDPKVDRFVSTPVARFGNGLNGVSMRLAEGWDVVNGGVKAEGVSSTMEDEVRQFILDSMYIV